MTNRTRTAVALLILSQGLASCGGATSPNAPSSPNAPPSPASIITPTVTAIGPSMGSTSGNTSLKITGTNFLQGLTVTIGGTAVPARFDTRSILDIYLDAPAHAEGPVDVVVTNPLGGAAVVAGGYTYAPPHAFDFNGTWGGYPHDGSDRWIEFTIRDNTLIRVSCSYTETSTVTFSPPAAVTNGEFSVTGNVEATMTGAIVAADEAKGMLNMAPPCANVPWQVTRQEAALKGASR